MLLLSPMSSKPHFSTILLPGFCLARLAAFAGRRALLGLLLASIASGLATAPVWGKSVGRFSMWCGMITWGALFLLAGCVLALRSCSPGRAARRGVEEAGIAGRTRAVGTGAGNGP
jgi:hypothetical protein